MTELIIRYAVPSGIADKTVIPSEVVGELVRCKDCEHHFYDIGNQAWFCHEHEYGEIFNDNDFCSWAKMKGGNDGSNY